jgi:hypothetical protein
MNNCINNGAVKQGSVKQFEDLIDIYGWLGNKAVLIPVPWGTKGPKIPDWQLTTLAASKAKESQDELKGAFYGKTNIGVVLGPSSQGLCAIDCDDEAGRAEMLRLNPQLSKTLCTVGARGCQFWLYIEGDIPSSTAVKYTDRFVFNEKTEKNVPAQFGEWRAEGNQSIIYGEHPNGNMYSVTQRFQPIECAFKDIVWPANTRFADAPAAKRNASAKTAAPQEETSAFNEWAKKYTGDLKTLDVYKLLAQHGITVTVEEGNKVCFRCPCENMHTGKNGDKDCSLYRGELKGRCMHESCGLNSFMALIDHLETRRPGCINDACMADFSDELSQEQLDRLYKSGDENFPAAMWEEAYQGPIGRLINAVIPHTEASKEALLVQALVMFGNALGRGPNIAAGGKHFCNEYAVIIGDTSRARKGTGYTLLSEAFEALDFHWVSNQQLKGIQSGEGIIHAIRDEKLRPAKTAKEKKEFGDELILEDEGVSDKRLLIVEEEFAQILTVAGREQNTVTEILRQAWDSPRFLQNAAKNSGAKATQPHVSLIGHITKEEFAEKTAKGSDAVNGTFNRMLFCGSYRSKILPDAPWLDWGSEEYASLLAPLRKALDAYSLESAGELNLFRDDEARRLWHSVYNKVENTKLTGVYSKVIGRAAPHLVRLSLIYAAADCSRYIRKEHIEAAVAVWDYCERSARWLFNEMTGNKDADKVIRALRKAPKGMTRTAINVDVFSKHKSKAELTEILTAVKKSGFANCEAVKDSAGHEQVELWKAVSQ